MIGKVRLRQKHWRDFWTYVRWRRRNNDWRPVQEKLLPRGDLHTVKAFAEYESFGKISGNPKHPRCFRAALEGKAQLNAQIKMWATGYWVCGGKAWLENELKPEYPYLPTWVWNAIQHFAEKIGIDRNINAIL